MSPARVLAALALIAAGTLIGRTLGENQKRRAECLRALCDDVKRLRDAMLSDRMPLRDALDACRTPTMKRWPDGADESLSAQDRACVKSLMDRLGEGGTQEMGLLLDGVRRSLEEQYAGAAERYRTLGRLYASLGALTALALALCFI